MRGDFAGVLLGSLPGGSPVSTAHCSCLAFECVRSYTAAIRSARDLTRPAYLLKRAVRDLLVISALVPNRCRRRCRGRRRRCR